MRIYANPNEGRMEANLTVILVTCNFIDFKPKTKPRDINFVQSTDLKYRQVQLDLSTYYYIGKGCQISACRLFSLNTSQPVAYAEFFADNKTLKVNVTHERPREKVKLNCSDENFSFISDSFYLSVWKSMESFT